MLEKAILYIRMTEMSMTKGAGNGVTLTDRALAYLANDQSLPATIPTAHLLNNNHPLQLLLFEPAAIILLGEGVGLLENNTPCPTTKLAIGTLTTFAL